MCEKIEFIFQDLTKSLQKLKILKEKMSISV